MSVMWHAACGLAICLFCACLCCMFAWCHTKEVPILLLDHVPSGHLLCMSIYITELGPCWEPSMGPDMKA